MDTTITSAEQAQYLRDQAKVVRVTRASDLQAMTPETVDKIRGDVEDLERTMQRLELEKSAREKRLAALSVQRTVVADAQRQALQASTVLKEVKATLSEERTQRCEIERTHAEKEGQWADQREKLEEKLEKALKQQRTTDELLMQEGIKRGEAEKGVEVAEKKAEKDIEELKAAHKRSRKLLREKHKAFADEAFATVAAAEAKLGINNRS